MKWRLKLLEKIAQAQKPVQIQGNPSAISTNTFSTVNIAWGTNNAPTLQKILDALNNAIFVFTDGQNDFNDYYTQDFNIDTSKFTGNAKSLILFSKMFYSKVLTDNGQPFKTEIQNKQIIINSLKNDSSITTIQDGGINEELTKRLSGNLKSILLNLLNQIK